jgi:hypothetical protein
MAFTYKHGDRPLDGYEIQRGVGRGGFGEVYYAISDGGREVALKYLRENPEVELRGISSCINLKSPHLVSIFDVKQNKDGDYFVIMEYISGPSLRDLLVAEPQGLGTQKAAFFVKELAKGLGYLHDRGIVHRDLKPGNIFYEDGYVKICDYGLSKYISVSRHSAQTASVGTVHYMAPEVGSGNYSRSIDIYALGVMLYEMLLGRVPYEGASMGEVLMKHLTSQPEVDQLPQPFASVIRKALAKDPNDRYQNVTEMVEDILGEEDVKRSVHGFEPQSLSTVAARAMQDPVPSPAPSDNPLRREFAADRQRAGVDFSRRFVERTRGLDVPMSKKERKRRKKAAKAQLLGMEHVEEDGGLTRGQRFARMLTALIVTIGAAIAIGALTGDGELGLVSFVIILSAVAGIGLANVVGRYLGPDHPGFIGRLLVLALGAPAVLMMWSLAQGGPASGFLGYTSKAYWPLLAALAVVDWRERIRLGRKGEFGTWEAFVAGLVAFVTAAIVGFSHFEHMVYFGGVAAAVSMSLQVFSWALSGEVRRASRPGDNAEGMDARRPSELDETRWVAPPQSHGSAGQFAQSPEHAPTAGDWNYRPAADHRLASQLSAGRPRSKPIRVLAAIACFGMFMMGGAMFIGLGVGEFRGDEEIMAAIISGVAFTMMSIGWAAKVTRYKRPTRWREWIAPFLTLVAGTGMTSAICGLALIARHDEEVAGFVVLLVVCSLGFIVLLGDRLRWLVMSPAALGHAEGAVPDQRQDMQDSAEQVPAGPVEVQNDFIIPQASRKD